MHVTKMLPFLFDRDMIQTIKAKLPSTAAIPHKSTVQYAMSPPNVFTKNAKRYTCRVQFKHGIQRRQLHAHSVDAHYTNAQRKYAFHYATHHNNRNGNIVFVSADDKSKIKFGEPNYHLAAVPRNTSGIAPTNKTMSAADHDVHNKGSFTPSVVLHMDIPEVATESFYKGQVHVSLKDSIFQPSNCFRTLLELEDMVKNSSEWGHINILMIFTDGGPEHLLTHESVRVSLMVLFKRNPNLDALIAIRTAPGQSYMNPVERTMSICNIALSNLATSRYVYAFECGYWQLVNCQ